MNTEYFKRIEELRSEYEAEQHIIDTIAQEHETISKITAHLANGEDNQAKAELSEMVWRLAGVADSLQTESTI